MSQTLKEQDFDQVLVIVTQNGLNALERSAEQKRILAGIAVEEIPDGEKLLKLRKAILKYNSKTPTTDSKLESSLETKAQTQQKDDHFLFKMKILTETFESFTNNMDCYTKLFNKVADVLRQENITAEIRVNAISNLLM